MTAIDTLISMALDKELPRTWTTVTTEELFKVLRTAIEFTIEETDTVIRRTGCLNEADYEGEMIADAVLEHFDMKGGV